MTREQIKHSLMNLVRQVKAFEAGLNHKPDWATHYTNRQWRKHSALLTSQHELARQYETSRGHS